MKAFPPGGRGALAGLILAVASLGFASSPVDDQLGAVRGRISELELRLGELARDAETAGRERAQLDAELELADARVQELELVLGSTWEAAEQLRAEAGELAHELESRQQQLNLQVQMMAVLGRPGPLQLLFDAAAGGDLERAVGTVSVLTAGQLRLVEEYHELRTEHGIRLAELSKVLSQARNEAEQLQRRRAELAAVRDRAARRFASLESSRRSVDATLADLRQREDALERLVNLLAAQNRSTGGEDIRAYRGALPWPVQGPVVQGFGRQRLPKYNTYTVCNGLRFNAPSQSPVTAPFPGVVAYARHFKGYGNMVVLDHGGGVYSLVAGLATIHVRVDQRVTMGMRLGLAPPPSDDGNIYLEFRVGEKPEDPRRWLQLKGESS